MESGMEHCGFYYPGALVKQGDIVRCAGVLGTVRACVFLGPTPPACSAAAPGRHVVRACGDGPPDATVEIAAQGGAKARTERIPVYGPRWSSMELDDRADASRDVVSGETQHPRYYYASESIAVGDLITFDPVAAHVSRVVASFRPGDPAAWHGVNYAHGVIWVRPLVGIPDDQGHPVEPFSYDWEDMRLLRRGHTKG